MEEENVIFCIDLKSFYASVECVDRGLNPFLTPLVVADKARGSGTIVLAVSPCLKKRGVPSRLRVYDLPKDEDIVFARPRMRRYLEYSSKVVDIFLDYVGEDDLHVYSIDECFLNITPYLHLHNNDAYSLAKEIKTRIFSELGLTSTVGIGSNMLLAKVSMDEEAKHTIDGIAYWTSKDVPNKLWNITPLSKMWGIGAHYERKLNAMGIYSIKDLATYPKKLLVDKFGVMGGQLWDHANGIDDSDIRNKYVSEEKSLTSGQVFFEDYFYEDIPVIIKEMLDDLLLKMILEHKLTSCVSLTIGYNKNNRGGFSHQLSLNAPSDDLNTIYDALMEIFNRYIENKPIRMIAINLSKLTSSYYYQPNLFSPIEEQEKKRKLFFVLAKIKERFGANAVLRTTSKLKCSNIAERHGFIGGHHG